MKFDLQPTLENEIIKIRPLESHDFEMLYAIAADPLLWEQHPNKDRYKRDVFENFFKGAIESGGAFLVIDSQTNKPIGSTRFYELDRAERTIAIGYTFIARDHWGQSYNTALKTIMLMHAFSFVEKVIFHIGAVNIRSQKSIEKIGATKIGELEMEYYGEETKLNFVYQIKKTDWSKLQSKA